MGKRIVKLDIPNANEFIRNLEEYIEKVNDICLDVISERLGVTKEEAKEIAERMQSKVFDDYRKEQLGKNWNIQ